VGPNPAVQATIRRREAEFSAVEATLRSIEEEVIILVERRLSELRTSRDTAIRYQMEVLPRVERLLKATQTGYTTGISTVIDVIGAQRELNLARKEFDTLSMDAVRAAITLETAVGETIK
jgi:outer membrane protein TolC